MHIAPTNNVLSHSLAVTGRYFRLLIPILFTSFIAYVLLKNNLMFNIDAALPTHSQGWLGTFYNFEANVKSLLTFCFYDVFFNYVGNSSYNSSLWTMPIEYYGSMIVYFIVGVFRQNNKIIYFLPLIIISLYYFYNNPALACFVLGYFFAEIYVKYGNVIEKFKAVNIFSILLFILLILFSTFYRPVDDRYLALLAALLVLSVTFSSLLKRIFSCSISKFFGRISFPLYLVHIIVICSLSSYLFLELPQHGFEAQTVSNIILLITVALSIFCAWIIFPIEKFSTTIAKYASKKILGVSFNGREL